MTRPERLLTVEEMCLHIDTYRGTVRAVDGVTFHVDQGESVGIVGESGSGKSMTALSLMRFTPLAGRFTAGSAMFQGRDLLKLSEREMRKIRGKDISMVFQDPMTFLNPLIRIGDQIGEVLVEHEGLSRRAAFNRAVEVLRQVRIPSPEDVAAQYPHQLSGGMRQRALIAMAIIGAPSLLIADEPTTALDVTVQAQIIELLRGVKEKHGLSLLMITHDLGIVAHVCDRVYVVYAGRIMEEAGVFEVFETPRHPYTTALLSSITYDEESGDGIGYIEGTVPSLIDPPEGCRFHTRCPAAMPVCRRLQPPRTRVSETQSVYCWLYEEAQDE
ncbi:ABC transporter ATP-binding protein [Silicimonas algicola]|uniref:Nickel import system ATP-binding protein NikD n=1 Tax=Silicimonas algicola TaxID=1826607 RepID=A0A316FVV1_9RHOB|nr:ABC transporter ATP-binding protein [Silicimonas algicola]AZQ68308.1 ABC transporter ATP-binding protein [Silicimonas algicola]PWK52718.1 peptide/nickel transport system ATP-binding protein/oligopeptide transport system ATP-binding protein [Silicimonas algicola]